MKKITFLICFLLVLTINCSAFAETQQKNNLIIYQQFSYYEKLYKAEPDNIDVLKNYLTFLEKNKYYLKAIELTKKLYNLTHETNYLIKQASLLEKQGDSKKALEIYQSVYNLNPKNTEIIEKIIRTYYISGKFKEALPYFKQYFSVAYNSELQLDYGKSLFYSGNSKEAKTILESYIKKNPDDFDALSLISDVYLSLKDYDSAIKTLSLLSGNSKEIRLKLGDAYFASGQTQKASEVFSTILIKDPQNLKSLTSLSDINLSTGDFEKAAVYLEKLSNLSQNPLNKIDEKTVNSKLGIAYLASKNYDKAEDIFLNLLNKYPDDSQTLSYLGDTYAANKKYEKAINLLKGALEKNQDNAELSLKIAKLYIQANNFAEAKKALEELNSKKPNQPEIIEALADVNFYTGEYKTAKDYYEKIYKNQDNKDLKYKYAECLRLSRNFENAESLYKELENSKKYKEKALAGMAYIKLENYKVIDSRKLFAKILKESPDNYDAKLGLGITYVSTEDFLKGLEILKSLPQNDEVRYEKGKAYYEMKMYSDAKKALIDNKLEKAKTLYAKVETLQKLTGTPDYDMSSQNGDADSKLDIKRYNVEISKYTDHNLKPKANFEVTQYSSGYKPANREAYKYEIGLEGRPVEKMAFDSKIGITHFSDAGNMLTGKLAADYYLNDKLKLRTGFERTNLERSVLSAVGVIPNAGPFKDTLIGQIADNKFNVGYVYKFPKFIFNYGDYNIGFAKGEHVPSNLYQEGVLGLGKVWYSRPKGHLLDLVMTELTGYYAHYDDNRLGYGGASLSYSPVGSDGISPDPFGRNPGLGGYFSPSYVFSEKASVQLRGKINKINTNYHLYGYAGAQNVAYNNTDFIWGNKAVLTYNEEGLLGLRLIYGYENYNQARRHNFMVNLIIRPR